VNDATVGALLNCFAPLSVGCMQTTVGIGSGFSVRVRVGFGSGLG